VVLAGKVPFSINMTHCKIKVTAFCEVCGKVYGRKPEYHLSYHTTDPANTAIYLASPERRIKALEDRLKPRRDIGSNKIGASR